MVEDFVVNGGLLGSTFKLEYRYLMTTSVGDLHDIVLRTCGAK
jgi:hypothetical protein